MKPEQEVKALEDAYLHHLQKLYDVMVTSLADKQDESECLKRFDNGATIARRAIQLALTNVHD